MPEEVRMVSNPLMIMYRQGADKTMVCQIHQPPGWTHKHYGLAVCDMVRHVANAYNVHEDEVWKWVEKERRKPTTEIKQAQ